MKNNTPVSALTNLPGRLTCCVIGVALNGFLTMPARVDEVN